MLTKAPEARPGSIENVFDASVMLRYIAPAEHTLDDVMTAKYWKNVLREVAQQRVLGRHAFNRIEVLSEDGSWEAELRVIAVGSDGLVETRLLREWHATPKARKVQAPKGYTVEHITGNGWRALDERRDIVAEKLATEDEALRAATTHSRRAKGD